MGLEIDREHFDPADSARFARQLRDGIAALRTLLARPGFGEGAATIGAELEVCLIDPDARPALLNDRVLATLDDPRVTLELDRFNLELNAHPSPLAGRPFHALRAELEEGVAAIAGAAAGHGARVVMIGVLPTLREDDLDASVMSDAPRYRALAAALRQLRRDPAQVRIDGDDPLLMECDDVTLEGAATALQIHLRVTPADYARTFNAVQAATGPALAMSGNSPIFVGRRLWEETRVALFRQAIDARPDLSAGWQPPPRVAFGHGWVRRGAHELFEESVALHPALLPACSEEQPIAVVEAGGVPALEELRLHHSTVWRWNRAVYDPEAGGHLRIEMRALPAGPTIVDMLANAAFLTGLALGLAEEIERLTVALPFEYARHNFYRAAQDGLRAELLWPSKAAPSPRAVPAPELIRSLLPVARRGLREAGVEADEIDLLLDVVAERVQCGVTGAAWQRRTLAALRERLEAQPALVSLVERYHQLSQQGEPVHRWPLGA